MKLHLTRPLVFFDIEATGLNVSIDRIVEIALIKLFPEGNKESYRFLVNPEVEIPQEVIAIHGITNEKVANEPTFKELATDLLPILEDADFAGYNAIKFDIPILVEEFIRAEVQIEFSDKKFVDVQNIFHKMEQRTLAAAYQFYCGKSLENAHSADADTEATMEVFLAQLDRYNELKPDIDSLADFSKGGQLNLADFAGRLAKDEKGNVVFNFGKHKGKTLTEVNKIEPGYYGWFVGPQTDFPAYTKMVLKKEWERLFSKDKEISSDDLNALMNKFKK